MAAASTFTIEAMVRGYHVYQSVWSPTAGEQLPCRKENGNIQDPFSVAIMERSNIVGHVPKKISSICSAWRHNNM